MRRLCIPMLITSLIFLLSCKKEAPPLTQPNPPSDLVATVISDTEIQLLWTDNSDSEEGFIIIRSRYGNEVEIFIPAGDSTYLDTGLESLVSYEYSIYAFNADNLVGESAFSESVRTFGLPYVNGTFSVRIYSDALDAAIVVYDTGGLPITQHGIIWSQENNLDITTRTRSKQGSVEEDEYSSYIIRGLMPETAYFLRGYAINSIGLRYSRTISVSTKKEGFLKYSIY